LTLERKKSKDSAKGEAVSTPFLSEIGPLFFLVGIFLSNFLSRIILSPLMPTIEEDLKLRHGEAGALFFIISLGYCIMVIFSGFISSRLNHRRTILLSSVTVSGAFFIVGLSPHLWEIRFGLFILGLAAGLYLPSSIATIIELVSPKNLGKAIAIHELAPNLGFVIAPFLAEGLLGLCSWRGILILLGVASILAGIVFAIWGRGGVFPGETPNAKILRSILVEPSFWIMMVLWTLGLGATVGVYSMIPLYLVSERGMDRTWANILLGSSRVFALGMTVLAGWVTDRFGAKPALKGVFLTTGLATFMLGVVHGPWIVLFVFLQPMLGSCFYSPGFAALSKMGSPGTKNVALSLTVPVGLLVGGGVIPAGIGLIGELGSFSLGFILLGGLLFTGIFLVRYLKLADSHK
jgi:NNP family nitrate/nitrite transporter-like MFS transporter